jgi:hypothetical protein
MYNKIKVRTCELLGIVAQDQRGDGCFKVVLHSTKQHEMQLLPTYAGVSLPI